MALNVDPTFLASGDVRTVEQPDDVIRLNEELAQAIAEVDQLQAEPTDSNALVAVGSHLPADELKKAMANRRSMLIHKTEHMNRLAKDLKEAMDQKMYEARMALAPLEEEIRRLKEGIWAVSLYLGRDEEIVTIRDGDAAPDDTPLVIRQMVLAMDEETAAKAGDGGIDFNDLDLVDEWLLDEQHLAQVAPWPRCIVVFRPRRSPKDYGDDLTNSIFDQYNAQSYWLLRNGDRLYRMTTDLDVGQRLIPRRNEFNDLFRKKKWGTDEYEELRPGSSDWVRAEAEQDQIGRHFMRCALVIQGLLDRTTVFQPFSGGEPPSVLRPESYDDGRVVLVADDDDNLISSGREPFYDWLRRLNSKLRPGMRIIGQFDSDGFRSVNEFHERGWYRHSRIHPDQAECPSSNVIYRLDEWRDHRGSRGLVFKYERTQEVWVRDRYGNQGSRKPKTRASCVVMPSDRFILPLDLVTVAEMRVYLEARTERHAYATMMPLLNAAIDVKIAEEALEAPFRIMLTGLIATQYGVDIDGELDNAINELVQEWKMSNRWHRPLVTSDLAKDGTDAQSEAKAVAAIVKAYGQRRGSGDEAVVARLLGEDSNIIYVGRARTGRYLAFAPQPRRYANPAAPNNFFVTEYRIDGTTGKGRIAKREWVAPGALVGRLRTLHSTPEWEKWDLVSNDNDHLLDDQIGSLAGDALARAVERDRKNIMAVTYDHAQKTFEVWFVNDLDEFATREARIGVNTTLKIETVQIKWVRARDGAVSIRKSDRDWGNDYWWRKGEEPWRPVFDGRSRHRDVIIQIDEVMDRALAVQDYLETVSIQAGKMNGVVRRATQCVETTWMTCAEATAYQRFLDDYGDLSLWEGHRKALSIRYPNGRDHNAALDNVFTALVNADRPLVGSVGDLWLAAATIMTAEAPNEYGETHDVGVAPDDIADIEITDEIEAEEETDA
jgi:hypothetical protein